MNGLKEQQQRKIKTQSGFLAALDQSGGSTPKALSNYGIKEGTWSNEEEMFTLVHEMRARIITSPSFNGDRILAAILFEGTMDRDIGGQPTADYLWNVTKFRASLTQPMPASGIPLRPFVLAMKAVSASASGINI